MMLVISLQRLRRWAQRGVKLLFILVILALALWLAYGWFGSGGTSRVPQVKPVPEKMPPVETPDITAGGYGLGLFSCSGRYAPFSVPAGTPPFLLEVSKS